MYLRLAPVGREVGPETFGLAAAVDTPACLSGIDCVRDGLTVGTPGGLIGARTTPGCLVGTEGTPGGLTGTEGGPGGLSRVADTPVAPGGLCGTVCAPGGRKRGVDAPGGFSGVRSLIAARP